MIETTPTPSLLRLMLHSQTADFAHYVRRAMETMALVGFPAIVRWEGAASEGNNVEGLDALLEAFNIALLDRGPVFVQLYFETGVVGSSIRLIRDEDGLYFCSHNVDHSVLDTSTEQQLVRFQDISADLCGKLLQDPGLYAAELSAERGGATAIPDVPLVDGNSHLCVTNVDEVEATYDDPEAFWNAGWTVAAEQHGQRLLTRDLDVIGGAPYLQRILPHQWAMARAARPWHTGYSKPELHPSEAAVYSAGEARFHGVGYRQEDQVVEFACALNRGEHIHGWEIFALYNIVETGKLADGSVVKVVRVVFDESWAAEQEKRPLLDIGCKVFHYRDDGELQEITESP